MRLPWGLILGLATIFILPTSASEWAPVVIGCVAGIVDCYIGAWRKP